MIALLRGLVAQMDSDRCVIDVQGVGYLVWASTRTLSTLPTPPEVARLLIETIVREDAIILYGFSEEAEREWFRLLTTVQGVGAKVALAILSVLTPAELIRVIASADKASLTRAAGVGARLADRILSELRNKVSKMPTGVSMPAGVMPIVEDSVENDALLALAGLGFKRAEAYPVVSRIIASSPDKLGLDAVLHASLKELAK